MRAHQPGSTPIDIPATVPNPAHTPAPAPAPERAPTKVPDKVPEKVMHALKKKSVTAGGGETLPIPPAYWPKPKRCYSTTAPNSSPSPGDYCRRERHESASAGFD